jgi:hypothetical protein
MGRLALGDRPVALAADEVDRGGPIAYEQGIRMHHERPICQFERLLESARQNAVGESSARKAGAVVRPRRQGAAGEPGSLIDSASPASLPALQSAISDAFCQGA